MMGRLIIYCPPYQEINFTALLKKKKAGLSGRDICQIMLNGE